MMIWRSIEEIPENLPIGTHALFWGRMYVEGGWIKEENRRQTWLTEWKVCKWAYVGRGHTRGFEGPKNLSNWFEPCSSSFARVHKMEATHYMPLPENPDNSPSEETEFTPIAPLEVGEDFRIQDCPIGGSLQWWRCTAIVDGGYKIAPISRLHGEIIPLREIP